MKIIYFILGTLSLLLGAIGIFLPVLPTTPLLLLASFFFIRSSDRVYKWLLNHKVFGSYIENYMKDRSIRRKDRMMAMILLWTTLTISMLLVDNLAVKGFLLVTGVLVSVYIFRLKVIK